MKTKLPCHCEGWWSSSLERSLRKAYRDPAESNLVAKPAEGYRKTGDCFTSFAMTFLVLCIFFLTACGAPAMTPPPTQPAPPIVIPTETIIVPTDAAPIVETPVIMVEPSVPFRLDSDAFVEGYPIPADYSCKGKDISPPLIWTEPPAGTQSFALIMDDPDAPGGTWDHWLVYYIPADVRVLPADMTNGMKFGDVAALFGVNSWGETSYGGPCPPSGTHHYSFRLYALDSIPDFGEKPDKSQLLAAMEGHILAQAELIGTFSK